MCYNYTDLTLVHIQMWPSVGLLYMKVGVSFDSNDIFWEDSVSSGANSSSVLYPPSTFCLWVALHVIGIPPDDAHCTLPPPTILTCPQCCLWRKCHPGSYYSSWARATSAMQPAPQSLAQSRSKEGFQSSTSSSVPDIFFILSVEA